MFKMLFVPALLVILSGCNNVPVSEQQDIQTRKISELNQKLPKGCTLESLGPVPVVGENKYRVPDPANVFYVRCDKENTLTTTAARMRQLGKNQVRVNDVTFEIQAIASSPSE